MPIENFRNRSRNEDRKITEWSDPPGTAGVKRTARRTSYTAIAMELQLNTGHWARLEDRASGSAAYQFVLGIVRGRPSAFRPAGAYEAAHDGTAVWVRHVGLHDDQFEDDGPDIEPDDEPARRPIEHLRSAPDLGSLFTL